MNQNFMPLFPHANQLDLGVDYINQHISELDRSIPDAAYSYELAIEYLAENRFNANNFKSIRGELNVLFNWTWFVCGMSIAEIDRIALRKFIDFCNQPLPILLHAPPIHFLLPRRKRPYCKLILSGSLLFIVV